MAFRHLLSAAAILATGCTKQPAGPADPSCVLVPEGWGAKGATPVRAETVVAGLEVPWSIAFLPGGDLLVTERPGRVRIVREGKVLPPVATLASDDIGEGGLLGAALAPDFESSGFFFLYVTKGQSDAVTNRVERWKLERDRSKATLDRVLLEGIPGATNHDGGRLRIGPDKKLYVGTGDAKKPENAPNRATLAGKLLRLELDGAVPKDNPFPNTPVFLSGIRNTQGYDWFDDGSLAVTDHGPSGELMRRGHDEVSVARAGDDLGWPGIFGCETAPGRVTPSLTWKTAAPPGGAAFYTGSAIPEWKGSLIVGTLGSKHLHRVVFDEKDRRKVASHEVYFEGDPPSGYGRLRDVVMSPTGELYVTTSNCDGRGSCPADKDRILKIVRQ